MYLDLSNKKTGTPEKQRRKLANLLIKLHKVSFTLHGFPLGSEGLNFDRPFFNEPDYSEPAAQ